MLRAPFNKTLLRGINLQPSGLKKNGVVRNVSNFNFNSNSQHNLNKIHIRTQFPEIKRCYSGARQAKEIEGKSAEHTAEDEVSDMDADAEYYVDVSNIESRWQTMNFEAQQDIISYLNVKQEFGWEYLTKDEKRAIYYIAYGKWGPRDAKIMSTAEFIFKLMTNMLLFSVLGFSIMNYSIDQLKIAELEAEDGSEPKTKTEGQK